MRRGTRLVGLFLLLELQVNRAFVGHHIDMSCDYIRAMDILHNLNIILALV